MAYSWYWATEVAALFADKHRRAVDFMETHFGVTVADAAHWIVDGEGDRWRGYKACAKWIDAEWHWQRIYYETSVDREKYPTFVKFFLTVLRRRRFPGVIDLLDKDISAD